MIQPAALDPLALPLHGRQVIEASAGTGKTWTLSALYLRLVLGLRDPIEPQAALGPPLMPPQILVMTFTEAATAELRERIRQRLGEAAQAFGPQGPGADAFLTQLRDRIQPHWHASCVQRLEHAAQWMDEAAIHTIHGWSLRMLREHAFDSQSLFEQTRLEDVSALQRQTVQDHWRRWFYPLGTSDAQWLHSEVAASPQALLERLLPIWRHMERSPDNLAQAMSWATHTPPIICAQRAAWAQQLAVLGEAARSAWDDAAIAALQQAAAQGQLDLRSYSAAHLPRWLARMQAWRQGADIDPQVLSRFGRKTLMAKNWVDAPPASVFAQIDQYLAHTEQGSLFVDQMLNHAASAGWQAMQASKNHSGQFDFSDLLQRLHAALQQADGRMAQAVRDQYPVALVDEFQDTDPWQCGSLERVYAAQAGVCWVMIGDPKQAIYSFRGADLTTYLQARAKAQHENPDAVHVLTHNHRSTPALVNAVNHVFGEHPKAFVTLDFPTVLPARPTPPILQSQPMQASGLSVWVVQDNAAHKDTLGKGRYEDLMAQAAAEHIAQSLQNQCIQAGQMAVLVRGHHHHRLIRQALQQRGVASVYLSERDSVYHSEEAMDLWHWLHALSAPRNTARLRAALATRLWGLPAHTLPDSLADNGALDDWQTLAHAWHQTWVRAGVWPMLQQWMHADNRLGSSLAQRLLASPDGERRINHLLHLGELLQHAGTRLSGCEALVRFLGEQIQSRSPPLDSAHMRLESDAQRVQIITYHKSKGLEYPWVWVPFLSSFGRPTDAAQRPAPVSEAEPTPGEDEVGSDEDMRLIYVALTRAREAAWVGLGPVTGELREASAKEGLLRSAPCELLQRTTKKDLMDRLQSAWGTCTDIHITALEANTIEAQKSMYLGPSPQLDFSRLATPRPLNPTRWWTASFSAMTRQLDAELAIQASDEVHPDAPELSPQPAADTPLPVVADPLDKATSWIPVGERQATQLSRWQVFPAGARSGLLLHDLLQWQCEHGWPLAHDGPTETALAPGAWPGVVARKAMALDLTEVQTALINPWLQALLRTPLPTPMQNAPPLILGQLKPTQAWAEMPFTLAVSSAATQAIDALICAHVLPGLARRALWPQRLNGMLTGVMDLVFEHHGRYGVLDYKSNRLDNYQAPDLNAAVLDHRYDVQYVLYTLALHRLLQVRLPHYDYDQHMGGAVYVFLRGIDQAGAGVHWHRPARALIEALDALLKKEVA